MNRPSRDQACGVLVCLALLASGCISLVACRAGVAQAQGFANGEVPNDNVEKVFDYFARKRDTAAAAWVRSVEYHHLSEHNFWKEYREGLLSSARSDLLYVLNYVPNHPKALALMAFDRRLDVDPSDVIQCFERAIRFFPQNAYTYAQYGRFLVSSGRRNAGLALLDKALRLDPNLVVARAWVMEAEKSRPESSGAPSLGPIFAPAGSPNSRPRLRNKG